MTRVFLCFDSGEKYELSLTPYHVFSETYEYEGSSDIAYDKFLKDNNLNNLSDFDLWGETYWLEVKE